MFDSYGFIFLGPGTDPAVDRVVIERNGFRSTIVPVPEPSVAVEVAVQLAEDGAQLVELCGAFGPVITAQVIEATGGQIPIGSVGFGPESVAGLAALVGPET